MRVALCFSGQLRNVQSTYERWYRPNVLEPNAEHQIDVFAHSWYDKTTVGTVYNAAHHKDIVPATDPIPVNVIQQVYEAYNPIQMKLEKSFEFDVKDYNERKLIDAVPAHGLPRLYSLRQSVELKRRYEEENNFTYDVVACARYDFKFLESFNFNLVEPRKVYHPGYSPHGFNVCYAMGDSYTMDRYSELFMHVDMVYRTGVHWCDELLAIRYLELIDIPMCDFSVRNGLNRGGI